MALLLAIGASALSLWPPSPLGYRDGQYMPADVTARVDFRVLDTKLLAEAERNARSSTPATFHLNQPLLDELTATIEKLPARLDAAGNVDGLEPTLQQELNIVNPPLPTTVIDADTATRPATRPAVEIPPQVKAQRIHNRTVYDAWVALGAADNRDKLETTLKELRKQLARCYFVRPERSGEQLERQAVKVNLQAGDATVVQPVGDLVALNEKAKVLRQLQPAIRLFDSALQSSVKTLLMARLTDQPMYVYDAARSADAQNAAATSILNDPPDRCYRHYARGTVLANRSIYEPIEGRMPGLSLEELQLLSAEHEAFQLQRRERRPWSGLLQASGRIGVVLLLTLGLVFYIAKYQMRIVERNLRALVLAILLLVMLTLGKILIEVLDLNPHALLLPVCMTGIILSIAYDQRFAMAVGAIFTAMAVFLVHGGLALLLIGMVGLGLCVFQLREIRTRSKLLLVSAVSAGVVFLAAWAVGLQESVPRAFLLRDSLFAAGAVLLAGMLVQSLLPAVETIFGVVTGSTLLEWCDASKPLLKRLAMESPGTYNHSLQLGAMCESAADAIAARGLLARVGAYYHDIGKLNKPSYFVENQSDENRHSRLSPAMSLLVIIGHVKDGLEMARQYSLPVPLREFVATHHGTTLVRYFYHTAKEKAQAENTQPPDENQFRYPGPKPKSKESGILMLADGAESSVRAMSEPNPSRIRQQVHRITTERLEDGQLDECELNLREVHIVEESLTKSLCGMYHSRIAYPKQEEKSEEPQPASNT